MFQYAFGFALSKFHKVDLYYDTRWFNESHYKDDPFRRRLGLINFDLSAQIWNSKLDARFGLTNDKLIKSIYLIKKTLGHTTILTERLMNFDACYQQKSKKNTYLFGYWQSYQYFKAIETGLRQQFEFPVSTLEKNLPAFTVSNPLANTICVHVRRGDYFAATDLSNGFGLLDENYFRKAICELKIYVPKGQIIFFSDDVDWCKATFADMPDATFAEHLPGMPDWYDMYRMSLCDHFVISNSTYSWWAAFLSKSPQKKVIVPKVWNSNKAVGKGMHPDEWVTLNF